MRAGFPTFSEAFSSPLWVSRTLFEVSVVWKAFFSGDRTLPPPHGDIFSCRRVFLLSGKSVRLCAPHVSGSSFASRRLFFVLLCFRVGFSVRLIFPFIPRLLFVLLFFFVWVFQ